MKKSLALMLALIMVLCMIPTTALAANTSTVVLHPSVNNTVTGVKVKVGDKIDGHPITKISGYDITVDLGKYNVNNDTFRLPHAKDIWEGVDNNKVDYISWAGSGSNRRSEGASALLANGKNTAYYYFKGAPTYKTFTLKYDANGGTGAPATQTYTATSQYENSHTFTISNDEPTRQDYEFKGWAETPNATTATRQPGGKIVVTGTTTLYAVWANHEHKDENDDGYCDTDRECMHEKDQDGYCIVDGCTHPHEGDGACCPKKSDNKPERPEPENTSKPVAGLTGEEVVKVECTTTNSGHAANTYQLIEGSYEVGKVQGDKESGYICDITVKPDKYVSAYNETHSVHKLETEGQICTIKLKWNENKWKVVSDVPVVFKVKCDNTQPPTDTPKLPAAEVIPIIVGKDAVKVLCTTNAKHAAMRCDLLENSFDIGVVTKEETSGEYFCNITVHADKYVEKYNEHLKGHTLETEGQTGTIKLKWKPDDTGDNTGSWKVDSGVPVVFNVKCDKTQPPLDPITIEVSKVWHDDGGTAKKPEKITVQLWANGKEVGQPVTIMPDNEDTWFHRFDNMPAKDSNGNLINYTVKEENVPGWTPYYYTAGPNNGKPMIFYIYNVPTKNTREIKVTKTVSGEGADKAKYFDFKVTLLEYHDNAEVTDQPGYYPLGGTYTFGGVTFTNGVATFKLKDGDSKEITGIPTHIYSNLPLQYKVEEIAPDGYTVKVNGKADSSINGDFTGDKTVNIAFENVKESGTNPTPTPGGGNGGHSHYYPTTTPVPVIVIPPKTGDMTIWQSILHFLGIR